jgi:hypothetical protein
LGHVLSPSLEYDVVGTDALSNSVQRKLGDNVEWSIDLETEVLVQTLCSSLISFVKIKNIPLLAVASIVVHDINCISFIVLLGSDIEDLVVGEVDELVVLELEDLPPA